MPRRATIIPFPGGPRRPPPRTDDRALVEVHRCTPAEALVVKSLLESERIPTLLRSRLVTSVHPFSVGAQGEVVVLVPASEAARGRRLLRRVASA